MNLSIGDKVKINLEKIKEKAAKDFDSFSFIGSKEYIEFINDNADTELKIVNSAPSFNKEKNQSEVMYYVNKSFATVEEFGFYEDELIKVKKEDEMDKC